MSMMKRIAERRLIETIPAGLRRWLLANPENRHLVDPAPAIKGESGPLGPRIKPAGKMVQKTMFALGLAVTVLAGCESKAPVIVVGGCEYIVVTIDGHARAIHRNECCFCTRKLFKVKTGADW